MGDGSKYQWQSWPADSLDGMPPRRRRLVVWGLLWLFFLISVVGGVLHAIGLSEPGRSLVIAGVLAAVFVPLIRAAVREDRALRSEGIDLPFYRVNRKSLINISAVAVVLWIIHAVWVWTSKELVIPLLPVACTIWVVIGFVLWRKYVRSPWAKRC